LVVEALELPQVQELPLAVLILYLVLLLLLVVAAVPQMFRLLVQAALVVGQELLVLPVPEILLLQTHLKVTMEHKARLKMMGKIKVQVAVVVVLLPLELLAINRQHQG
jgi:hypothetical protein